MINPDISHLWNCIEKYSFRFLRIEYLASDYYYSKEWGFSPPDHAKRHILIMDGL